METIKISWDYRLMAKEYKGEIFFDIHSVYYQNNLPIACSLHPAPVGGSSVDEVIEDLALMKECFKKPIIWYGNKFPKEYDNYPDNVLNKVLNELHKDKEKHPIKWWFDSVKCGLYCRITNNKLIRKLKYKIKKNHDFRNYRRNT